MIVLALVAHVVGQGLITSALARLAASFSSVALLVQPVVAAFAASLLFGESVGVMGFIGAVIIMIGIVVAGRQCLATDSKG